TEGREGNKERRDLTTDHAKYAENGVEVLFRVDVDR
ncbi:MAG: hypothetical protein JWM99_5211, partial [Verrucomicrobiales bacterium]|nr:hypothetical protein [Verrucomicrobiales bacterium]